MQHLACIMDGNRRWARGQHLESFIGHYHGAQTVERVIKFCLENNISYLSLYAFSLENFNRSEYEKNYIFDLIKKMADEHIQKFVEHNIRVIFVGDRKQFPRDVLPAIELIEQKTAAKNKLTVQVLFCYGARQEIIEAAKKVAHAIKEGSLQQEEITQELFSRYLWTAEIPSPDLIIRTGGACRLSNFLLYQAAYSEFYFLDCFWPELQETHLRKALDYFYACKRNFGS